MKGVPKLLQLETLNKVIQKMDPAPNLFFTNMFDSVDYPSDTIRWAMEYGTAGMTPFVAPGAPAPAMGDEGLWSEGSARAAYWKEKVFLDEVQLNNLRRPLTEQEYYAAARQLARKERRLRNRCDRRKEWMMAKCFFDGGFTFQAYGGAKFTVNYGVPSTHQVTLSGDDVWWDDSTDAPGSTATPIRDIFDAKKTFSDDVGVAPVGAIINSELLKVLMFSTDLQTLLQKSAFGEGDLFARPASVLGNLLGVGALTVYDEMHEVGAWLTQDASSGASTIYLDDATDMEADNTVRFYDLNTPFDYEEHTISSVDIANGTITIDGTLSQGYKANKDRVVMRKKFITDDKFFMYANQVDGEDIAEFMNAPFGNDRHYGMYGDTNPEWDPEGIWVRIQNKGLPVLYHPDAIYTLTVK